MVRSRPRPYCQCSERREKSSRMVLRWDLNRPECIKYSHYVKTLGVLRPSVERFWSTCFPFTVEIRATRVCDWSLRTAIGVQSRSRSR